MCQVQCQLLCFTAIYKSSLVASWNSNVSLDASHFQGSSFIVVNMNYNYKTKIIFTFPFVPIAKEKCLCDFSKEEENIDFNYVGRKRERCQIYSHFLSHSIVIRETNIFTTLNF